MNIPPPTTNFEFGLQNKNSASERIGQIRAAQQEVVQNKSQVRSLNSDSQAEFGLQDRGTASERVEEVLSLKNRVIENHGFEAKLYTRNALANNTKIINIPVQERGSLLDIKI